MATITVSPGQSIQAAINSAEPGDIIVVQSGVYNENITINKAITLQGPNQGVAPTVPDINVTGGISVNEGYRTNAEAWIQGTITVASDDVTIDGFRLRNEAGPLTWQGEPDNFKLLNNYVTGYNADNAPTFGNANSNNPTDVVSEWELSGNYIGGLTGGIGGSMYLAGLSDSSISNNTFWRPRAAHLYLASLTDVNIEGNTFFHGLHAGDFNEDGLLEYFSGPGYGYGGGRNYWFELKGTNDTVNILNNSGQFNSGGIQLYSKAGETNGFVFNNITIEGNTFPSNNFINPYMEAPTNDLSGLIPAVMATAANGAASGENLVIRNNTVELDLAQIKYATDHQSALDVRGNFNGVTVFSNTVSQIGDNTSPDVNMLAGINLYGGLSGPVLLESNQFQGTDGTVDEASYYGIDFIPSFPDYGTFTGELTIIENDISDWQIGVALRLVEPGPDVSDQIDIRGNTFDNNEITVFDEIAPQIFTDSISYPEDQAQGSVLGTVDAADNLANTDNVGIVNYFINPGEFADLFSIDPSTGTITLTEAGLASAANNFEVRPNSFVLDVTVTDAGGLTFTNSLVMRTTDAGGRELLIEGSDFEPGQTIESPQDRPFVFVAAPQENTVVPSPFPDLFDLTAAGEVPFTIQGTLAQLNGDIIRGFARGLHRMSFRQSAFPASRVTVIFGSAILEIDANDDGNTDATVTLEGDFTDAVFLVNPDEVASSTEITYDILGTVMNRFRNEDVISTYLFAGEEESVSIRENFPNFVEEGIAFKVGEEADRLMRINRFRNDDVPGTYLFAGEEESVSIREDFPNFVEEGIAFYAASQGTSTGESIYRFQSLLQPGTYIFVGEEERDSVLENFSDQFTLEGVAFELVM